MAEDSGGAGGGTATASPPSKPAENPAPKAEESAPPTAEGSSAPPAEEAPAEKTTEKSTPGSGTGDQAATSPADQESGAPAQEDREPASPDAPARDERSTEDGSRSELEQAVEGQVQEVTPPSRLRAVGDEVRNVNRTATAAHDDGKQGAAAIGQAWYDSAGEATRNRADVATAEAGSVGQEATAVADYTDAAAAHVEDGIRRRTEVVRSNDAPYQYSHLLPSADGDVARKQIESATVQDINREDEVTAANIRSLEVGTPADPAAGTPPAPVPATAPSPAPPGEPAQDTAAPPATGPGNVPAAPATAGNGQAAPTPAPAPPPGAPAVQPAAANLDNAQAVLHNAGQDPAQLPQPPEGATPEEIEAHWMGLAEQHPELVGNRDGVPAAARDAANRILLNRDIPRIESDHTNLTAERERLATEQERLRGPGHDIERLAVGERIRELDDKIAKLDGIRAIHTELEATRGAPEEDRFFLLDLDQQDDGRFIIARGNPDTADHVATFVPGAGSDLGDAGNLIKNGDAIHRAALDSANQAGLENPPRTSVITWLGYDAPDSVTVDAPFPSYAENAAGDLARFQQGLRDSHYEGRSHNTLIGYSYGGTTAGTAAREYPGLPVDDFVSVGSPGLGTNHASGLNLSPSTRVWATEFSGDPIGDIGSWEIPAGVDPAVTEPVRISPHGADPTDPAFGSQTFGADPVPGRGDVPPGFGGHIDYFRELGEFTAGNNTALSNLGHIVAGNPLRVR